MNSYKFYDKWLIFWYETFKYLEVKRMIEIGFVRNLLKDSFLNLLPLYNKIVDALIFQ